jgi:hypothetical protein
MYTLRRREYSIVSGKMNLVCMTDKLVTVATSREL